MNDLNVRIDRYQMLFIGCLILAAICLVIAYFLFFKLNISGIVGYLTGRSEKREIKELERNANKSENRGNGKFVIVQEIMLLHTDEMIGEGGKKV